MDLDLFFTPIDENITDEITSISSFYKGININKGKLPALKGHSIALIGINSYQNNGSNHGIAQGADIIREKLYHLKRGEGAHNVIDLGNLNPGVDLEETYGRLKEVCEFLIRKSILPVIIGGAHNLDYGQFMAYEGLEKLITVLNVDAFLDMEESESPENTHIHDMLVHEPNYLFHYSHLAYQSYLIEKTSIGVLERLYFETYRIGHLRELLKDMEPIIREADMLSFDISAIRSSDAPGSNNAQPFGLTGEEACQICWYAGQNEKLSSAGFYEYDPSLDDNTHKTASVIATMVWYFLEGVNHRKGESSHNTENYLKYVVELHGGLPASIVFFKSNMSERWWMEIPLEDKSATTFGRNSLAPCSYSDYETAIKGEVPDRYVSMLARLN